MRRARSPTTSRDETARSKPGCEQPQACPIAILLPCQVYEANLRLSSFDLSGDEGARTPDIRLAKAALSQLSYIPVTVGL